MKLTGPIPIAGKDFTQKDLHDYASLVAIIIKTDPYSRYQWAKLGFKTDKELFDHALEVVAKQPKKFDDDVSPGAKFGQRMYVIRDLDLDGAPIIANFVWSRKDKDWDSVTSTKSSDDDEEPGKKEPEHPLDQVRTEWYKKYVGGKEHYRLDQAGTLPSHQRHGAATTLMRSMYPLIGNTPCVVASSEVGLPFYQSCGWKLKEQATFSFDDDVVVTAEEDEEEEMQRKGTYTASFLMRNERSKLDVGGNEVSEDEVDKFQLGESKDVGGKEVATYSIQLYIEQ